MSAQRFQILDPVGAGNFGVIHRGVDHQSKDAETDSVAIKELKQPINMRLLNREIKLQYRAQMACSNVVQLRHIVESVPNEKYLLVMELLPMDMRSFLTAFYCPHRTSLLVPPSSPPVPRDEFQATYGRRYVPLPYVKRMMAGLLNALACVHAQGIAHRDVKPENILIEPMGLAQPLRGVHTPAAVFAGRPGEAANDSASRAAPSPLAAGAPSPVCVALQDGMTVEEIIATTRAIHCLACHAQLPEKQPRLAALTAAALRAMQATATGAVLPSCQKGSDSTELQESTGTDTAAGVTDSTTPSDDAVRSQDSLRLDEDEDEDAHSHRTESASSPWLITAHAPASPVVRPSLRAVVSLDEARACPLRPEVKLGDFGSARDMRALTTGDSEGCHHGLTGCPTTYVYCAPEMMLQHVYTPAVDVWAAGMILFELATGELLLRPGQLVRLDGGRQANSDFSTTYRLMRMIYVLGTPTEEDWDAIASPSLYPPEVRAVLPQIPGAPLFDAAAEASREAQDGAPAARAVPPRPTPGAHQRESEVLGRLLFDSIGADGVDLLRRLITYDPGKRITAQEALQHPFLRL